MAEDVITFTYPRVLGDLSITIKGQDYGSDEEISRRQLVGETKGDQLYVYDEGVDTLELNLSFFRLDPEERGNLEWWFKKVVGYGQRWFKIALPSPVRREVLRAGATVGGVSVKAGDHKCGAYVLQDDLVYYVRLMDPRITFTENVEAHYNCTLRLRVLTGFRPTNRGGP